MFRIIQSSPFLSVLVFVLTLALIIEHASTSIHAHALPSHADYSADPDYSFPSGAGGIPQTSGGDGSVVIITKQPTELRSTFFYTGSRENFIVPGSPRSSPYHQTVQVKLWGAGGGGCDGGRLEKLSDSDMSSSGYAGGYVEASFDFPIGESLIVDVGSGGKSQSIGSQNSLLGGLGGYNGGKSGYSSASSRGGGGGGTFTQLSCLTCVNATTSVLTILLLPSLRYVYGSIEQWHHPCGCIRR